MMFSLLITTRNRQDLLNRQLAFLRTNLFGIGFAFETIIYDDASDTPLILGDDRPESTRIIRGETNIGLIEARNVLMKNSSAQSNYLFFLDDDIFVYGLQTWIRSAIVDLDSGYGVVSLPYLNLPLQPKAQISCFKFIHDFNPDNPTVVYFNGGSSAFSRKAIESVGYLEGHYFFFLEEEDFSLRLYAKGISCKVATGLPCISIHDQPPGKNWTDRRILLLSNRLVYHHKFIKSFVVRTLLNSTYILLYACKLFSIARLNDAISRYKDISPKVIQEPIPTSKLLRFLVKRYFNL